MAWLSSLFEKGMARLRSRKERDQARALYRLKARYHIFRVVLADNERALGLLAEVDRLSREAEPEALAEALASLGETVLDLVDGVNRLDGSAHLGLYARLADIRGQLAVALDRAAATAPGPRFPGLDELGADARTAAGGKAVSLALLRRAGLPVPDGFAIPVAACREHLQRTRIAERLRPLLAGEDDEAAAREIQRMILAADLAPEFREQLAAARARLAPGRPLAVRSSALAEDGAEHSFAGQYRSILQVTTQQGLEQAFCSVLASAFSARVLAYRRRAGLPRDGLDMAVLCLEMVEPRAAGVLFTRDPTTADAGRMLVSAVPGMGTAAVSGSGAADIYRPARDPGAEAVERTPVQVADKAEREVADPAGGLRTEPVPQAERHAPLLSWAELAELRAQGLRIEALAGGPQDIEWAVDRAGALWILQARPARVAATAASVEDECGRELLSGVGASPGRAAGRVARVRTRDDLEALARDPGDAPLVLVLAQSLPDAARLLHLAAGVAVDLGNPLDHLSCVAREQGVPMATGLGRASEMLHDGDWVLVDGDRGRVLGAQQCVWKDFAPARRPAPRASAGDPGRDAVRNLVLPLNLTDAYGPTFSATECRSLHDLVRYVHEKAVLAMFEAGDEVAEEAFSLVRRLDGVPGMPFLVLDVGGGLAPGPGGRALDPADIRSEPLAALFAGMTTPGLRWGVAPPVGNIAGLMSRAMLDKRGERPVGEPNYALVSRDYLNLNAKVDYHFAMVDAVCGRSARENGIRFRFKGGGTARVQRERRARLVEQVLAAEQFFATREGDMVTAQFTEGPREMVRDKLAMLGRFLGFSRLLDAAMVDDEAPGRAARAFLEGDYALASLEKERGE